MDVDGSFVEYVTVRWSMLYRLATLLVGTERADQLTQAGLIRAYLAWPDVQEAASADVYVKRVLADTAVNGAMARVQTEYREVENDAVHPSSSGGEKLWAEMRELLPRQRAVLVLRHYERFSDSEIADALGGTAITVAAESRALETGIDLSDLRDELLVRSEAATVPHPPIDALVVLGKQARQRRRSRSWKWTAGVAAVGAAALVTASMVGSTSGRTDSLHPTSSAATVPRFLSMLPSGAAPRIAYSEGFSLHLGSGRMVTLADLVSTIVQTQKWLFVVDLSGKIVRVDTATGDVTPLVAASHGELVTDPAGEHIAWLAAGAGPAVAVVQTVVDGAVALSDEQTFPADPRCCDNPFVVNGITQDGEVIGSLPAANRAWVWISPDGGASQVHEIEGLGTAVIDQVVAAGIVAHRAPFQYIVGHLDDSNFVQTAVLTARIADFTDPLGHRVVYADEDGKIHVREIRTRGRSRRASQEVPLLLPTIAGGFASARWEDQDHVLLDVADASLRDGALVRCAVATGACEIAARFNGLHLVAD
jgi:DNA-directed RNA polymerase specialized sigma24 family protein